MQWLQKLLGNNDFGLVIDAFDGNEKLNTPLLCLAVLLASIVHLIKH